ncbi:hypothetical protein HK102_010290, partial [Quaeritorhiza haematococci]
MSKAKSAEAASEPGGASEILREPAEAKYAEELEWLRSIDGDAKPASWRLSPRMDEPRGYGHAVWCARDFAGGDPFLLLLGDHLYLSSAPRRCARQLIELATAESCAVSAVQATQEHLIHQYGTLTGRRLTDRPDVYAIDEIIEKPNPTLAELRLHVPGLRAGHYLCFFGMHVLTPTVFELLAAAVCGDSTRVVQGTAGTTEDHIKYSWNVAMVIAAGQSRESLIPSPIMTAMQGGLMGRFEELTRCSSDVQDALISILSEKYITIPELKGDDVVFARPGFNIIATANARDRGVNELSSALKRRFNFVQIPVGTNKKPEREVVLF